MGAAGPARAKELCDPQLRLEQINRLFKALVSEPRPESGVVASAPPIRQTFRLKRGRRSEGTSADVIYRTVAAALRDRHPGGGVLLDVGCGSGNVWPYLRDRFERYVGIDLVRYDVFPDDREFVAANLDLTPWPIGDASGHVVISVETIEHLENPRAFMRELVRLTKPNGWVVVSMPNQLGLLSRDDAGAQESIQCLPGQLLPATSPR